MTRKDIIRELNRENNTRRRVFPRWIASKRIHKELAEKRLECTAIAEALFREMTDKEFTGLCDRLEIKTDQVQGKLF